jgi:hypothetical protein
MGRPLNKKYFGAPTAGGNEIKVQFHNGTSSVNGYIVKQLGSKKFRCTDGVTEKDCFLTNVAGTDLTAGQMSIVVKDAANAIKQVTKISGRKVTVEGTTSIAWAYAAATATVVEMEEAGDGSEVAATVINAITAADPGAVTTTANHLLVTGDRVRITGVVGMTELNGNVYTVTKTGATTFTIGVDTSDTDDYTAYTSGGAVTQVEAGADVFEAN